MVKKMSKEKSFEEQLKRLEEIVAILENDETSLDDMLKVYEEGMLLTKKLREYLNTAEMKITDINQKVSS